MQNSGMTSQIDSFQKRMSDNAVRVETLLGDLLDDRPLDGEISRPSHLLAAMKHGVLNGGKRLRPFLLVESAALFDADAEAALRVGAALECLHSYSLVHDDLPAMDDDDLRRGKPTVHIAFDEATAILAGDSLLTLSFDIIASPDTQTSDKARVELILGLARAAGLGGMAGGQALDLAAEKSAPDENGIVTLQAMKTGALIRYACEAGAILADRPAADRLRMRQFGELLGRAFQLADDLLDLTADAETMGKATGKDAARGKGTLVALKGKDWAEAELGRLVDEATLLLEPFEDRAVPLIEAARFIASRKY